MVPADAVWLTAWEKAERPYPWTAPHFEETLISLTSRTLVWEEGSEPVGFAVVQVVGAEAYLLNIMTSRQHRRQGQGIKMMKELFAWALARGASDMVLDVDPANSPAVKLYEKSGFYSISRRPQSYPRGEAAVIMKRKL